MKTITQKTPIIDGSNISQVTALLTARDEPVVIKNLVKHWPLVQKGLESDESIIEYLKSHYNGKPAGVYVGEPEINGRFAYDSSVTKLNFANKKSQLDEMLDAILLNKSSSAPQSLYVASNRIAWHFPTLTTQNNIPFAQDAFLGLSEKDADLIASLWIGNKTLVSCHFDAQSNVACCVAGKRRFTLFPPEQINNLYPGPLEPTPGGQVISMVDFSAPDLDTYPRFSDAIEAGQIAEMEPGDALFLPSMWWHQVEALSSFNVLLNYWWNTSPIYRGQATDVLTHALLSIRDCPEQEKKAWKAIFDYYIFAESTHAGAHLPDESRGALGKIDPLTARRLRAKLLNQLNR